MAPCAFDTQPFVWRVFFNTMRLYVGMPAVLCMHACTALLERHRRAHTLHLPPDLQIYPEGGGELGWDLNKVAEVLGHCGDMRGALRLWQEGAQLLRASFGEPRGVMGIVFKAEFFLDDDEDRRAEVAERLGPSLPEAFTRGIPG